MCIVFSIEIVRDENAFNGRILRKFTLDEELCAVMTLSTNTLIAYIKINERKIVKTDVLGWVKH